MVRIYTERKNIRLKIRFPHRKEFNRYFKENEWENVANFIKEGFEEWLNGKMLMLNQTQDKESVGVVAKTSEKVSFSTNKVIKEISISDSNSKANSTILGNIGPEAGRQRENKTEIDKNDYSFVNTDETGEAVTPLKSTSKLENQNANTCASANETKEVVKPLTCVGELHRENNNTDIIDQTEDDETHMLSEEANQLTALFGVQPLGKNQNSIQHSEVLSILGNEHKFQTIKGPPCRPHGRYLFLYSSKGNVQKVNDNHQ